MSIVARLLTLLAALLAIPLLTAGTAAEATGAARTTETAEVTSTGPTFVVNGGVAEPLTLSVPDLRRWPAYDEVVHFIAGGRQEVHQVRGVRLIDVLTAAKPQFNPSAKHDELRHAVLVGATDGYGTVLSWGEIDPAFVGTDVLLAFEQDGRDLTLPRLVVPSDKDGGRYVTDISSISLLRLGGHPS